MKIRFFEAAFFDLENSRNYYSKISTELETYFINDIRLGLNQIRNTPKASPPHHRFSHLRMKMCKRFPFSIIYHFQKAEQIIYIVAIAHHKRSPEYWSDRITE